MPPGRLDDLRQNPGRALDQAARARRLRKTLDQLEQDNFGGDPGETDTKSLRSAFTIDTSENIDKSKKRMSAQRIRRLMKRNLSLIIEEQCCSKESKPESSNYLKAVAPASKFPKRHFCAVCGYQAPYTCCQCGTRFCTIRCKETHKETRCLKWLV